MFRFPISCHDPNIANLLVIYLNNFGSMNEWRLLGSADVSRNGDNGARTCHGNSHRGLRASFRLLAPSRRDCFGSALLALVSQALGNLLPSAIPSAAGAVNGRQKAALRSTSKADQIFSQVVLRQN